MAVGGVRLETTSEGNADSIVLVEAGELQLLKTSATEVVAHSVRHKAVISLGYASFICF